MKLLSLIRTALLAVSTITVGLGILSAEAVGGSRYLNRLLAANTYDPIAPIPFQGGRQAIIKVEEKASASLEVAVYNPDGTLQRRFVVAGHSVAMCWFDPPVNGSYAIVVTNLSKYDYGEYLLTTN